jgi:hypothetical protein
LQCSIYINNDTNILNNEEYGEYIEDFTEYLENYNADVVINVMEKKLSKLSSVP